MTDFFITIFRQYENKHIAAGTANADEINTALTTYFGTKLKEVNYLKTP